MSLDIVLGTNVQVIDLILPFLDNDSILSINRVQKRWTPKRSIVVKRKYGKLTILDLSHKSLTTISKEIGQLQNLQVLFLEYNKLTLLPKEIGQLQNLEKIIAHKNKLTSIPPDIGKMQNLELLYLCNNQLKTIPHEIKELQKYGKLGIYL